MTKRPLTKWDFIIRLTNGQLTNWRLTKQNESFGSIDNLLITKDTTGFNFASGKNATGGKSLLAKVMAPMLTRIVIKVLKEGLNYHWVHQAVACSQGQTKTTINFFRKLGIDYFSQVEELLCNKTIIETVGFDLK